MTSLNSLQKLQALPKRVKPEIDLGGHKIAYAEVSRRFLKEQAEAHPDILLVFQGKLDEADANLDEMQSFQTAVVAYAIAKADAGEPDPKTLRSYVDLIKDRIPEMLIGGIYQSVMKLSLSVGEDVGNFPKGQDVPAPPQNRQQRRASTKRSPRTGSSGRGSPRT